MKKRDERDPRKVHAWLAPATESGDPKLWPRIAELYRSHPGSRHLTLWHLPFYWREHAELVAPLIREALADPAEIDGALHAASAFPGLLPEVLAVLAAPGVRERLGRELVAGVLASMLGLVRTPGELPGLAEAEQARIREEVARRLGDRCPWLRQ